MESKNRKAIILVHGMGNQIPLTSIREFVENVNRGGQQLYSSPDRIVGDLETRRFSYHNRSYDYYEMYWAHLMDEPSMFEVIKWSLTLLFLRKPSDRAKKPIWIIRFLLVLCFIGFVTFSYNFDSIMRYFQEEFTIITSGIVVLIFYKLLYPMMKTIFSNTILQSIGDVVKYTVPSPKNINVRNTIRQKGLDMLIKLHEAKNSDGDYIYNDIILVGHSLGSIVCYDLLTFLFPKYNTSSIPKSKYNQDVVTEFVSAMGSEMPVKDYQEWQRKVVLYYRKFEMKWRISDFITVGSPLTHVSMLLAKDLNEVRRRQEIREFPTCPPITDLRDKHKYFYEYGDQKFLTPHHAALFAFTRWTNIYFKNDYIGGKLSSLFGHGIKDYEMEAESSVMTKIIPFASHSSYWDKKEEKSLTVLNELI